MESDPHFPALLRQAVPILIDRRRLLIFYGIDAVSFSGTSAGDLLPRLLPLLNGERTVSQLADYLPDVAPDVILQAVSLLSERGLVVDKKDIDYCIEGVMPPNRFERFGIFLSACGLRGRQVIAELRAKRVGIAGAGTVSRHVAHSLLDCGVKNLSLIALPRKEPLDNESECIALLQMQIMAYDPNADVKIFSLAQTEELDCDLIVAAQDYTGELPIDLLNKRCLASKTPWLLCRLDYHVGEVGPLFIPGETACHTCFGLRRRSNVDNIDEYDAIQHALTSGTQDFDYGLFPAAATTVGGFAAGEAVKFLTSALPSSLRGRFVEIDFRYSKQRSHEVLKLPRCPTCSGREKRPPTKLWDLESIGDSSEDGREIT